MKGQDILLLLKLISLNKEDRRQSKKSDEIQAIAANATGNYLVRNVRKILLDEECYWSRAMDSGDLGTTQSASDDSYLKGIRASHTAFGWEGWDVSEYLASEDAASGVSHSERYSLRGLAVSTGISKSEVKNSLTRSINVGLAVIDRQTELPRANQKALFEFIKYGIKYVFPAVKGPSARGIPTAFAAPVMMGKVMTAGNTFYLWPDAHGKEFGQSIEPLFKSVPYAVKRDPMMYELLALIDAVRIGSPREVNIAIEILESILK